MCFVKMLAEPAVELELCNQFDRNDLIRGRREYRFVLF